MTEKLNNIVILGAAESGVGAALLAQAKGYAVFVSDRGAIQPDYKARLTQAGIEFEENQHTLGRILQADEVVKSPGIPEKAEVIKALREKGTPIISEIEFAGRYTQAKSICITGTNGKTTTTLLTYHLLKSAGLNVGLAGNVGFSLAEQVIEDKHDYYVLELSSFQLDDMHDFRPWVSVLLNITPDHLDRYEYSMEKYAQAKLRITRNLDPNGYFIYNLADPGIQQFLRPERVQSRLLPFQEAFYAPACFHSDSEIWVQPPGREVPYVVDTANSPLIGRHNRQNMLAAVACAYAAGVPAAQIETGLATFQNADHRLQLVGEINGVRFINDSKATNVEAAWFALDGMKEPMVWIAGGVDKGNDYTTLLPLVQGRVKALVCLGTDNAKLRTTFDPIIPQVEETQSMADAVRRAAALAQPGDVVLLSPCCASFDLFKNYEDRGRQFAQAVRELAPGNTSQSA